MPVRTQCRRRSGRRQCRVVDNQGKVKTGWMTPARARRRVIAENAAVARRSGRPFLPARRR